MSCIIPKELLMFCKAFGIFPAKNIHMEQADKLEFSSLAFIYSLVLVAIQTFLCLYSLSLDLERFQNEYPIKLQTNTAVVVMFCDIVSLSTSAVVFVITSGSSCTGLIELYCDLQRFDDVLKVKPKQSYMRSWFLLSVASLTAVFVTEFATRTLVSTISPVYISVFTLHYIALAVQLQYLSAVNSIHRRFQLVNQSISKEVTHTRFRSLLKLTVLPTVENMAGYENGAVTRRIIGIHSLSDLHWVLCGAIHKINTVFSWQLLALMLSLFLHIIIAPYFFFFSMNSISIQGYLTPRLLGHLILQVVWVITHLAKLILLVWPCAATTQEANETAPIVCKLLNREMSTDMRKQLETFVLQLLHHNAEFSAFGLFSLQCPILTSIAGAVTTYLVILIQFQNADAEESNGP